MARVSVESSIAMGQVASMKSNLFHALVSPLKVIMARVSCLKVQFSIAKQVPPSPSSSTNIPAMKLDHVVDMPTTDLPSDDCLQASSVIVHSSLMASFWDKISCCFGQRSAGLPVSITENTKTHRVINPMAQFRDQEIGKTMLTFVVPMTTGVLVFYNKDDSSLSPHHFSLILVSLAVGLTALWNGLLLRNTLPDVITNAVEQFGGACIFFAFFSVLSSLLPLYLVWLPWTCFVAILLPSILSCIPVKDGACHGG